MVATQTAQSSTPHLTLVAVFPLCSTRSPARPLGQPTLRELPLQATVGTLGVLLTAQATILPNTPFTTMQAYPQERFTAAPQQNQAVAIPTHPMFVTWHLTPIRESQTAT